MITALEARSDDLSLNNVEQVLEHEKLKMRGHERFSNIDEQRHDKALVGDDRRNKPHKSLTCFGCGKTRHFKRDCPKVKKNHSYEAKSVAKEQSGASAYTVANDKSDRLDTWLVNSGATSHMTWNWNVLVDYREFETPEKVVLGDGHSVDAIGVEIYTLR